MAQTWLWAAFVAAVGGMLAVDLGALDRRARAPSLREAAVWSAVWIGLALCFAGLIWALESPERAMLYLTGYVLEKSLSADNLFVFLALFRFFRIGPEHRPHVLHWGILGAIALRFVFIAAGAAAVRRWALLLPLFGAVLVVTGAKMLRAPREEPAPDESRTLRALRAVLPVTETPHGRSFFVRTDGRLHATPLFAALALVEAADLVFAADSIPAALAVTPDLFLVYTSNVFAILGLRSLYFLLEGSLEEVRHLKTGISVVLVFIGGKLLAHRWVEVSTGWSLAFVAGALTLSIAASLADPRE